MKKDGILLEIISETSYLDKPTIEAINNINKWEERIDSLPFSNEEKELIIYILKARKENLLILESLHN